MALDARTGERLLKLLHEREIHEIAAPSATLTPSTGSLKKTDR